MVTSYRPPIASSSRLAGSDRVQRQPDAEDQREEHDREHVPLGRRLERVRGDDLDEKLHPRLRGARGSDARRAPCGPLQEARLRFRGDPLAGPDQVDQDDPQDDRDGRHDDGVGERLRADPPEAAKVAEPRHAEHEGGEDQGHDQHEEQAQEDLPRRLGDVGDEGLQARVVPEQPVRDDPREAAGREADRHPGVERELPPGHHLCLCEVRSASGPPSRQPGSAVRSAGARSPRSRARVPAAAIIAALSVQ